MPALMEIDGKIYCGGKRLATTKDLADMEERILNKIKNATIRTDPQTKEGYIEIEFYIDTSAF